MTMTEHSTPPTQPDDLAARGSPLAGAALLIFLFFGLLSSGRLIGSGQLDAVSANLSTAQTLDGGVTHEIAKALSKASVATLFAELERGASWLLLGDTGPRVRTGCTDWLFLADELKVNHQAQLNADAKAQAVIDLKEQLFRQGINLLVVIVPDKSRIASVQRCSLYRPASLEGRIQAWTSKLNVAGVANLDLTGALTSLGPRAYLRTDTHWSESGAKAAAESIAQHLKTLGISATPRRSFTESHAPFALRPGDLVHLAGIDWLPLKWQPTPEMVAQTSIRELPGVSANNPDDEGTLFGDANLPGTALIGTSFSRNSNFAGFMQQALGATVGNFAKDGGAFSGAVNSYINNPAFKETPPNLIIWEIPERDLQSPYTDPIALGRH
ncbi:alginate O-acetyltransferase AlgX-related protein [Pseudomonas sp. 10S4]|uniref:alginate O-acetyltransferase AlgX-related protein n=1 Tax=Pseudomonas sp. 10S4 TaxID=3048583 RepID=UPI002B236FB4|nr:MULTISPECIES: cell division protein FtsQ [unclassified Pseudomonas]MEB0225188.1 cell division protein FtsQ [Pseudomonas sp. 5S1]MEB0293984.1 cell division protein FtsQ [Pseudomonas sp. 10S4]